MTKKLLIANIGLAVVAVVVLVVGIFFSSPSPQEVIAKSFEKSAGLTSVSFTGSVSVGVTSEYITGTIPLPLGSQSNNQETPSEFFISFGGSTETAQIKNPKTQINLSVETEGLRPFGIKARIIEKVVYLKLDTSNIPEAGFFSESPLLKNWIVFDPQTATDQFGIKDIQVETNNIGEKLEISEKEAQQIYSILVNAEFLQQAEDLGEKKINGTQTHHYRITVSSDELEKTLTQIDKVLGIESTKKNIAQTTKEDSKAVQWEMWIGKKDYLPRKIIMQAGKQAQGTVGSLLVEIMFNNFNREVAVSVPENTITIQEALSGLFGGSMQINQEDGSFRIKSSFEIDADSVQENIKTPEGVKVKIIE